EDGIRVFHVTGVQTCALPILGGQRIGSINAENWRAWNFSIRDAGDVEVARITKTWEGLAKTLFTTADNYVVQIHQRLADPLRSIDRKSVVKGKGPALHASDSN